MKIIFRVGYSSIEPSSIIERTTKEDYRLERHSSVVGVVLFKSRPTLGLSKQQCALATSTGKLVCLDSQESSGSNSAVSALSCSLMLTLAIVLSFCIVRNSFQTLKHQSFASPF